MEQILNNSVQRQFLGAKEVSEILGVSESKSYGVIRELNNELKSKGFIIVPGKISRRFFFERCYCDETEVQRSSGGGKIRGE